MCNYRTPDLSIQAKQLELVLTGRQQALLIAGEVDRFENVVQQGAVAWPPGEGRRIAVIAGTPCHRGLFLLIAGTSSATATSGFVVQAKPARGARLGVLLYNNGAMPGISFQGGTLCVSAQMIRRGGPTDSLGTPGGCDGAFAIDLNTFAQGLWVVPPSGAIPANTPAPFLLTIGQSVWCQFWGRDTLANGSLLSDGLRYAVRP